MFHAKNLSMKEIWNKICCIFTSSKKQNMAEEVKDRDYIKATGDGRLYIENGDFFTDKNVVSKIDEFMNSSFYKSIIDRQELAAAKFKADKATKHKK